jgi:hypothetical protein
MVLPSGAAAARTIAEGAYWLGADTGEITWDTGGNEVWTASSPGWQPVQAGFESDTAPAVSGGWLAWTGTSRANTFLVRRPGESAQLIVPDGVALTGGWLILGSQPGQPTGYVLIPTKLEVVWLSDLE